MNFINAFIMAMTISFTSQFLFSTSNVPVAVIPFEMSGSHITVEASVNGSEPLPFTFDTGGATGLVDKSIAERIGMKETSRVPGLGAGGRTEYSLSAGNTIKMGDLTFENNTLVMADMSHTKQFGKPIGGVLGYHQIVGYVVKIDYVAQKLFFYDKDNYEYSGNGSIVPIGLERRIPSMDAEIELTDGTKVSGRFLLDTGAALYGSMNSPSVQEHDAIATLDKSYQVEAAGATGTFKMTDGRVKSFTLGDHTFNNSPFTFSESGQGATADPNYVGLMGNQLARRFNIILDYAQKRIILEPNSQYNDPYKVNASGITLRANDEGKLHVHKVIEGSSAHELGLKEGDVLESIDGKEYSGMDRSIVNDLFKENGTRVELAWKRNGKLLKGTLILKDLI